MFNELQYGVIIGAVLIISILLHLPVTSRKSRRESLVRFVKRNAKPELSRFLKGF